MLAELRSESGGSRWSYKSLYFSKEVAAAEGATTSIFCDLSC